MHYFAAQSIMTAAQVEADTLHEVGDAMYACREWFEALKPTPVYFK